MSRNKSSKRQPPDIGLFMECEEEELNPAQTEYYKKLEAAHSDFKRKLDEYVNKMNGEVVVAEGDFINFEIDHGVLLRKALSTPTDQPAVQSLSQTKGRTIVITKAIDRRGRPKKVNTAEPVVLPVAPLPVPEVRGTRSGRTITAQSPANVPVSALPTVHKTSPPPTKPKNKPSEENAVGGLIIGSTAEPLITVTYNDSRVIDAKEVLLGKLGMKNYPSLAISVKPCLQTKFSQAIQNEKRATLDVQVKGVLMFPNNKFTEWLIQQGLALAVQQCPNHPENFLQLGMYTNNSSAFALTGGLVWLSECCPQTSVSVFRGSIFERSTKHPNVLLKLMYHWACETSVSNVMQWVKVDAWYIRNIYTLLRAVAVMAVHKKFELLGGRGKSVQVASIILSTTSPAGKHPKFEIIGVMDEMNLVRFRALDVEVGKKSKRKNKLDFLSLYVDKRSRIVTDIPDFKTEAGAEFLVCGTEPKELQAYMRKYLPRLFQVTLSHISKVIIQQFLDELVWRERWGPIPSLAFNNLVAHLAELTKANSEGSILDRLKATAENPFQTPAPKDWELPKNDPVRIDIIEEEVPPPKKRPLTEVVIEDNANENQITVKRKKTKKKFWVCQPSPANLTPEIEIFLNSNVTVSVDQYYYGTLPRRESKWTIERPAASLKCCICWKNYYHDSIRLMRHLFFHYQPDAPTRLNEIFQCEQCFLGFSTSVQRSNHFLNVHVLPESEENRVCLICEKLYSSKEDLTFHMHSHHVAKEMPYACQVCKFRTSSYSVICEHIFQVHKDDKYMFCPYCLMSISLSRGSKPLESNMIFFVNHILRHTRHYDDTLHCHRCKLSFVNYFLLERHLERDHSSYQHETAVIALSTNTGAMMPAPGSLIQVKAQQPLEKKEEERKSHLYSFVPFLSTLKLDLDEDLPCAECEGSLLGTGHFEGEMTCLKCNFKTYCELSMLDHCALYHGSQSSYKPGKPGGSMFYCSCLFFSFSGNKLAKHLLSCGKSTAYLKESAIPSEAKRNTAMENEEPNVLNTLGLIRKSPEPADAPSHAGLSQVQDVIRKRKNEEKESPEKGSKISKKIENEELVPNEEDTLSSSETNEIVDNEAETSIKKSNNVSEIADFESNVSKLNESSSAQKSVENPELEVNSDEVHSSENADAEINVSKLNETSGAQKPVENPELEVNSDEVHTSEIADPERNVFKLNESLSAQNPVENLESEVNTDEVHSSEIADPESNVSNLNESSSAQKSVENPELEVNSDEVHTSEISDPESNVSKLNETSGDQRPVESSELEVNSDEVYSSTPDKDVEKLDLCKEDDIDSFSVLKNSHTVTDSVNDVEMMEAIKPSEDSVISVEKSDPQDSVDDVEMLEVCTPPRNSEPEVGKSDISIKDSSDNAEKTDTVQESSDDIEMTDTVQDSVEDVEMLEDPPPSKDSLTDLEKPVTPQNIEASQPFESSAHDLDTLEEKESVSDGDVLESPTAMNKTSNVSKHVEESIEDGEGADSGEITKISESVASDDAGAAENSTPLQDSFERTSFTEVPDYGGVTSSVEPEHNRVESFDIVTSEDNQITAPVETENDTSEEPPVEPMENTDTEIRAPIESENNSVEDLGVELKNDSDNLISGSSSESVKEDTKVESETADNEKLNLNDIEVSQSGESALEGCVPEISSDVETVDDNDKNQEQSEKEVAPFEHSNEKEITSMMEENDSEGIKDSSAVGESLITMMEGFEEQTTELNTQVESEENIPEKVSSPTVQEPELQENLESPNAEPTSEAISKINNEIAGPLDSATAEKVPITEETAESLIEELEDIMTATDTAAENPDFIEELINEPEPNEPSA